MTTTATPGCSVPGCNQAATTTLRYAVSFSHLTLSVVVSYCEGHLPPEVAAKDLEAGLSVTRLF